MLRYIILADVYDCHDNPVRCLHWFCAKFMLKLLKSQSYCSRKLVCQEHKWNLWRQRFSKCAIRYNYCKIYE